MSDIILTGASRGIGGALATLLGERRPADRLLLVARDAVRLEAVATRIRERRGQAVAVTGDLSTFAGARALGVALAELANPGATLIHNAGIWPTKLTRTPEGLETAFVVNHLAPLLLQRPLLEARKVARVMVVSAGLIIKGRFDPARTPTGEDFSRIRTYCTTKLCLALAMRDLAADHPELDVVVLHPGVVRTGLGASAGPVGWLLAAVKRFWEKPETCAERLARILGRERWSPPGEARWLVEENEQPWPEVAQDETVRRAVREVTEKLLEGT